MLGMLAAEFTIFAQEQFILMLLLIPGGIVIAVLADRTP